MANQPPPAQGTGTTRPPRKRRRSGRKPTTDAQHQRRGAEQAGKGTSITAPARSPHYSGLPHLEKGRPPETRGNPAPYIPHYKHMAARTDVCPPTELKEERA